MIFMKPYSNKIWESTPLNTKMIYYPKWREYSPNKWIASSDFLHSTRAKVQSKAKTSNRNKRTASWKTEPYIDGLKALGDRKKYQEKEMKKRFHNASLRLFKEILGKIVVFTLSLLEQKRL